MADEKKDQPQESAFDVTELDDQALEGVSGGAGDGSTDGISPVDVNENCHSC